MHERKKALKMALEEREKLRYEMQRLDRNIFKYETMYLEMTKGYPLTKNSDYYLCGIAEKKKYTVDDKTRIFSREYPGSS